MGRTGTRDSLLLSLALVGASAATALAVGPPEPEQVEEQQAAAKEPAWWEKDPLYGIFALLVGMVVLVITALVVMARR